MIFERDMIMGVIELFFTALALSADAFAVSVCKGLAAGKVKTKHYLSAGLWFGGFQALMPFIGYLLGSTFGKYIVSIDHWISFVLLAFIGGNMIRESCEKECECECKNNTNASFAFKTMLLLAVATSIDALAVGVTFALLPRVNIWVAVSFIGILTFIVSAFGVKIGSVFGMKYKSVAEKLGGIILIIIGLKILVEHIFFS